MAPEKRRNRLHKTAAVPYTLYDVVVKRETRLVKALVHSLSNLAVDSAKKNRSPALALPIYSAGPRWRYSIFMKSSHQLPVRRNRHQTSIVSRST